MVMMNWDDLLQVFALSLIEKSPHTRKAYQRDVEQLQRLAGRLVASEVTAAHIRQFIAQRYAAGLSGRSLARLLAAWRRFFNVFIQKGLLKSNPCHGLRAPKTGRTLPQALAVDATAALLDRVQIESVLDVRDKALFELLYSSGLRLTELTRLNLEDVDFSDNMLHVLGKGNKARIVPLGRSARAALLSWLAVRQAKAAETALFTSRSGDRLGGRQVENRLRRWSIKSGSERPVHPHMLRHSFASHLLQSSGDLRAVQELLGHTHLTSTQIYTHLDYQHLAQVYDRAHPRAQLMSVDNNIKQTKADT